MLVDARGADDGEATQHVARAVQWSATIERRRMTPAFARERPAASLLKPSMRWCCLATLLDIIGRYAV